MSLSTEILAALAAGPLSSREICKAIGLELAEDHRIPQRISGALTLLNSRGEITRDRNSKRYSIGGASDKPAPPVAAVLDATFFAFYEALEDGPCTIEGIIERSGLRFVDVTKAISIGLASKAIDETQRNGRRVFELNARGGVVVEHLREHAAMPRHARRNSVARSAAPRDNEWALVQAFSPVFPAIEVGAFDKARSVVIRFRYGNEVTDVLVSQPSLKALIEALRDRIEHDLPFPWPPQ